ncbi:MAG TPA: hypothetical protein DEH25_06820 [Chloroflexi bacterium]|nr:hypothetical protein [Chloroflexota bacterium]HBY09376.1 hypothetical protein [Chloroflexota bacterium]
MLDERLGWVLTRFNQTRIDYAFLDEFQKVCAYNPEISRWLENPHDDLCGLPLTEVFPEFVGLEEHLPTQISDASLTIPRVQRSLPQGEKFYFDLRLERIDIFNAAYLLTISNTTRQARLEQQLIQQRNELRLQVAARERAEEALREANDQLERRVTERTTELQEAYQRLQTLSRRLVEVQEAERRQIARELHDEIGQALTGLKLLLGMNARNLPEEAQPGLGEVQTLVVDLMGQVRQLSLDLRPAMLDDLGLIPALLWHFERYERQTQIRVDFKHSGADQRFEPHVETAAYRIIQEGLTNVARYAGVKSVLVRLWHETKRLHLRIEDRGCGFDPVKVLAAGKSNGLSGMQERAALLAGWLVIESSPGCGTTLTAELPLADE